MTSKESTIGLELSQVALDVAIINGLMNGFFKLWNYEQVIGKKTLGLFFQFTAGTDRANV